MAQKNLGYVEKKFDKGFGFIRVDGQKDDKSLFFHAKQLKNVHFDNIKIGDRVSFEGTREADTGKGREAYGICVEID